MHIDHSATASRVHNAAVYLSLVTCYSINRFNHGKNIRDQVQDNEPSYLSKAIADGQAEFEYFPHEGMIQ